MICLSEAKSEVVVLPTSFDQLFKGWGARPVVRTGPRWFYTRILGSGIVWKCEWAELPLGALLPT